MSVLLDVRNLTVEFETRKGAIRAVDQLHFKLEAGHTLGIVGESGSGKSVTSLALMGLLAPSARVMSGEAIFQTDKTKSEKDLLKLTHRQLRDVRGNDIAMIFQDPMTSLNPSFTVGFQIKEALKLHTSLTAEQRQAEALSLLAQVGISDAKTRLAAFPHQLSGGMSQRVMIAMAVACSPKLLIADEPTTALDVTIQAQILELLRRLQREKGMSLILISHDIGVVASMAENIMVMYAGQAVEYGPSQELIQHPKHPYTKALLESLPSRHGLSEFRSRLPTMAGLVLDKSERQI